MSVLPGFFLQGLICNGTSKMASINPSNPPRSLIKLHSKDHEEILDVIDQLRSEGVSRYVGLPLLIVCGDQSSGKSSVLEAISGLDFPR